MWLHHTEARWADCVCNVAAITSGYGISTLARSAKARWKRQARKNFGHKDMENVRLLAYQSFDIKRSLSTTNLRCVPSPRSASPEQACRPTPFLYMYLCDEIIKFMRKASRQMDATFALEVFDKAPYVTVSMTRPDGSFTD